MSLFFVVCALLAPVPASADTITVSGRGTFKGKVLLEKGTFYVERSWIDGTPAPSRHVFVLKIPASNVLAVEFNDKRVEECDSICRMPAVGAELDGGTVLAAMPSIVIRKLGGFREKIPNFTVIPTFTTEKEQEIGIEKWLNGNFYDRTWRLFAIDDTLVDLRTPYSKTCTFHPDAKRGTVRRLDFRAPAGAYSAR